jgi:hypothetical protein
LAKNGIMSKTGQFLAILMNDYSFIKDILSFLHFLSSPANNRGSIVRNRDDSGGNQETRKIISRQKV